MLSGEREDNVLVSGGGGIERRSSWVEFAEVVLPVLLDNSSLSNANISVYHICLFIPTRQIVPDQPSIVPLPGRPAGSLGRDISL